MTSAYCCECLRGLSSSRAIRVVRALFTGLLLAAVAHAQCVTYGGTVTGTASANAIALNNAFSALSSPGGCIQFPSGTFTIDGSLVNAFSPPSASFSLTLVGTGTESTVLYFTGSNGITINATTATQTVHVRDLTFSTDGANSYTALTLNNTYPNISGQPVELSDIYGLIVNGNMILIDGEGATGNSGILLAGSGGLNSIVNNVFVGANDPPATTGYGIYVETPTGTTVVTGNSFHQLHEGVELYAASQWNVQANLYDNVTTHVANIGSNSVGVATQ